MAPRTHPTVDADPRVCSSRQRTTQGIPANGSLLIDLRLDLNADEANVTVRRAAVQSAMANLNYCKITSPVDGTVISRKVDVGQTVAASCHSAEELAQAERLGLDFVVLGPVRATESHPEATPLGWERFAALRESVSLPIYALGGMKPADQVTARRHGGQGVAGIRGLWPR